MANKKRANGDGSIYQRKDTGKWVACTSYTDLRGKLRRKTFVRNTQREARIAMEKLRESVRRPLAAAPELTVEAFLQHWLDSHVKRSLAEATHLNYKTMVVKYIVPVLGKHKLSSLKAAHVTDWQDILADSKVGSATRRRTLQTLKAALNYGLKMGLLGHNPCVAVKLPRHRREEIKPFTDQEVKLILDAIVSTRFPAVYHMAFKTGMRQGEIFGLRKDAVDFDRRELTITSQACEVAGKMIVREPKTAAGRRTIPIPQDVVDLLIERKKQALREGTAASPYFFCTSTGSPIQRTNFGNRHWKKILEKLEVEHRGIHHCRHTCATKMLRDGVPVHVVSALLGHSSPQITLMIYAHWIPADNARVLEVMKRVGQV